MKRLLLLLALAPLMSVGQNVKLNAAEATVKFDIDDVEEGTVSGLKIDANLNLSDPKGSYINASVDAKTINTGVGERDQHIKSGDEGFLNVGKYDQITFKSNKIVKTESGYMAYGDLTIAGTTQPVEMPFIHKDSKLIGRMKIHTGNFHIYAEPPADPDAVNCIIRIEVPVK